MLKRRAALASLAALPALAFVPRVPFAREVAIDADMVSVPRMVLACGPSPMRKFFGAGGHWAELGPTPIADWLPGGPGPTWARVPWGTPDEPQRSIDKILGEEEGVTVRLIDPHHGTV
jgi:hypothetical protein